MQILPFVHGSIAFWLAFVAFFATAQIFEDDGTPSGQEILSNAFRNLYDIDLSSKVVLVARTETGQVLSRKLDIASKTIDGQAHSIGRLFSPIRLRGMTVLMIEAADRHHDAFVFLPAMGRVRRISTAQRSDSFFGTDVTYEDLERRREDEYEVIGIRELLRTGERSYEVTTVPVEQRNYEKATFHIARSDFAILETEFFKRSAASPYRVIRAPRESMARLGGHILPTRLRVENRFAKSWTEVEFHQLRVDRKIDDRLFSVGNLIREWRLPTQSVRSVESEDS